MTFDLAVIGGGVVGCALFRRFALGGAQDRASGTRARHPVGRQQGQQRHAPYRLRCADRQPRARLHAGGLCRISRHPRAPQSAAAGDRRADGRLDRGGAGPASPPSRHRPMPMASRDVRQIDAAEARRASRIWQPMCWAASCGAARASHRSLVRAARLCAAGASPLGGEVRRDCEVTGGDFDGRRLAPRHHARARSRRASSSTPPGCSATWSRRSARPSPISDQAAQGPVRRLRQARRTRSSPPASCRCRASAPKACAGADHLRQSPGRAHGRGAGGSRACRPSDARRCEALIARGQRMVPALAGETVTALYAGLGRRPSTRIIASRPCGSQLDHRRRHPLDRSHRRAGHRPPRGGALSPGFRRAPRASPRRPSAAAESRRASAARTGRRPAMARWSAIASW